MNIKKYLRKAVNVAAIWIGPETVLKLEAKIRFNKKLNLKSPKTLSDKICWMELRRQDRCLSYCLLTR